MERGDEQHGYIFETQNVRLRTPVLVCVRECETITIRFSILGTGNPTLR